MSLLSNGLMRMIGNSDKVCFITPFRNCYLKVPVYLGLVENAECGVPECGVTESRSAGVPECRSPGVPECKIVGLQNIS